RREELTFLEIDGLARARHGLDEVRLATEKGRGLQHVDRLRDRRDVLALVHVGEHRQTGRVAHLGEDREALVASEAAERVTRRAVGLVVGRLEDQRHAQLARERGETLGVPQRRVAALDDARAGDDRERRAAADAERSDLDPPAHLPDPAAATLDSSSGWCPDTRSRWSIAARMKLLKIGWQS